MNDQEEELNVIWEDVFESMRTLLFQTWVLFLNSRPHRANGSNERESWYNLFSSDGSSFRSWKQSEPYTMMHMRKWIRRNQSGRKVCHTFRGFRKESKCTEWKEANLILWYWWVRSGRTLHGWRTFCRSLKSRGISFSIFLLWLIWLSRPVSFSYAQEINRVQSTSKPCDWGNSGAYYDIYPRGVE